MPDPTAASPAQSAAAELHAAGWEQHNAEQRAYVASIIAAEYADQTAALKQIAEMAGQTLLCADYEIRSEADRAYQVGANRAFEDCAAIAIDALEGK